MASVAHGSDMVAKKLSIAGGGVGTSVGIAVRRVDGGMHWVMAASSDVAAAPGSTAVVAAPGT